MNYDFAFVIDDIFTKRNFGSVKAILPCGNHDLKRNMVYKVHTSGGQYVIKFFYKPGKCMRELNALSYYQPPELSILASGVTDDHTEWIIYNHIEGELLDRKLKQLKNDEMKRIFNGIGYEMGRLHQAHAFDYFGDWDPAKKSPVKAYVAFMKMEVERIITNINAQTLPGGEILRDSISVLKSEMEHIEPIGHGRLCHRDLDGRNILIDQKKGAYEFKTFLDFEKCVVDNCYNDVIGLFRKYFLDYPYLLKPFFYGYKETGMLTSDFYKSFRFLLYKNGLHICSWTYSYSKSYYHEGLDFLKKLLEKDRAGSVYDDLDEVF